MWGHPPNNPAPARSSKYPNFRLTSCLRILTYPIFCDCDFPGDLEPCVTLSFSCRAGNVPASLVCYLQRLMGYCQLQSSLSTPVDNKSGAGSSRVRDFHLMCLPTRDVDKSVDNYRNYFRFQMVPSWVKVRSIVLQSYFLFVFNGLRLCQ